MVYSFEVGIKLKPLSSAKKSTSEVAGEKRGKTGNQYQVLEKKHATVITISFGLHLIGWYFRFDWLEYVNEQTQSQTEHNSEFSQS